MKNAEERFLMDERKAKLAQSELYSVIGRYSSLDHLSFNQTEAFQFGAKLLEEQGEKAHRDAVIMRYHASNPKAVVMRDAYTLRAIQTAIRCMEQYIQARGGTGEWAV